MCFEWAIQNAWGLGIDVTLSDEQQFIYGNLRICLGETLISPMSIECTKVFHVVLKEYATSISIGVEVLKAIFVMPTPGAFTPRHYGAHCMLMHIHNTTLFPIKYQTLFIAYKIPNWVGGEY